MKRYWLSLLLGVVIVAGIGVYYIDCASDHVPQFKLATVAGDPQQGAKIELSGSYSGRFRTEPITVNAEGSIYQKRQSLYTKNIAEARSWFVNQSGMAQLVADHRDFMRGKGNSAGFYKDDEWLIYADPVLSKHAGDQQLILKIDLLDLAAGHTKSFEAKVDVDKRWATFTPLDVQRSGSELHILVARYLKSGYPALPSDEYCDYVINIENGSLNRTVNMDFGLPSKQGTDYQVRDITNRNVTAPSAYSAFAVNEFRVWTDEHGKNLEKVDNHLYVYSYETGDLQQISNTSSDSQNSYRINYALAGDRIVQAGNNDEEIYSTVYNMKTGQIHKSPQISAEQLGVDRIFQAFPENGRIVVSTDSQNNMIAFVLDATDGKVLYKGEVTAQETKSEEDKIAASQLFLPNIGIQY